MAISYQIFKTDPTKYSEAITVPANNTNDTDTSLTFVGGGVANFGSFINTDFLHLLENFANSTPPAHAIQGQLWYDTSNDSKTGNKLKVFVDPTHSKPVNGVFQQAIDPTVDSNTLVSPGDVWVDTSRGQLFVTLDGLAWNLVGPTYSSVLKTGSYPEVLTDISGAEHRVIKNYIDDKVIEIIANTTFTPNPPILGFSTGIAPGLNLSSTYNSTLNATAKVAKSLLLANGSTVTGDNLVRTDIDSTINATLSVRNVNIGSSAGGGIAPWTMKQDNGNATFNNPKPAGRFSFKVTTNPQSGIPLLTETLIISGVANNEGTKPGVGISLKNNANPSAELDVGGDIIARNSISVTNTTTVQGVYITTSSVATPSLTVSGLSTFNTIQTNGITTVGGSILRSNNSVNIGSLDAPLNTIFSQEFVGQLSGNVTGSASSLTNVASWSIAGEVSATLNTPLSKFWGQPAPSASGFIFTATLTPAAILAHPSITAGQLVSTSSYLLIANQGSLNRISRSELLSEFSAGLIQPGTIFPFAGLTPPTGYLFCDGLYVSPSRFPTLFTAIGYTYGKGGGAIPEFALPDLRSKGIIGFDDMNNNNISATLGVPGSRAGLTDNITPNRGLASIGSAPLVDGQLDVTTGTTTVLYYQAMNYIIKI